MEELGLESMNSNNKVNVLTTDIPSYSECAIRLEYQSEYWKDAGLNPDGAAKCFGKFLDLSVSSSVKFR